MRDLSFARLKHILTLLFLVSKNTFLFGQVVPEEKPVDYQKIFTEIKTASSDTKWLWNKNIYAPILFINPKTREIISNEFSAALKWQDSLYIGQLPENINIANTALEWNDKRWAMIMLPLPDNKFDRINLIAHELFHKAQPDLGFTQADPVNTHLEKEEGRIYLTLELEALKEAVLALNYKEQHKHIINALTFRKYRHYLFPGSDSTENKIELNEGITEYTGFMVANRPANIAIKHFTSEMNSFLDNSSFVRSFTFHTIPVYGFLLNRINKNWNKEINNKTDLTVFFTKKFNYKVPTEDICLLSKKYGYNNISEKEKGRAYEIAKKQKYYRNLFLTQPHLKISFEKMNVSFNTNNILPLDSLGTVYPTIRVTDNWGILEVTEGALMSSNWKYIIVSNPMNIKNKIITGKGWILKLNENYKINKDHSSVNFFIEK